VEHKVHRPKYPGIPNLHTNPRTLQTGDRGNKSATLVTHVKVTYFTRLNYALRHEVWGEGGGGKCPRTLHLTLDKRPQPFYPRIKWPRYPTWTRRGEHRNSEIIKSLKTESFEPHHSRWGWEESVVSQSLFISLGVSIHTLRCTNSDVFDYGVLFQTPMATSRNIRYTCTVITFLKSEIFCIPKHT